MLPVSLFVSIKTELVYNSWSDTYDSSNFIIVVFMCRLYFSLICLLLITSSTFASLSVDTVVKRIRINRELLNIGIISDAQFPENDENLSVGHWGV